MPGNSDDAAVHPREADRAEVDTDRVCATIKSFRMLKSLSIIRLARFSKRHSVGAEASAVSRSHAVCIRTSFLSVARIGKHPRDPIEQPQSTIELPKQQHASVAGNIAAVEIRLNAATLERLKLRHEGNRKAHANRHCAKGDQRGRGSQRQLRAPQRCRGLVGLTVSYRPTRSIALQVALHRETRASTAAFGDYVVNVASVTGRIGF
jgi:hypothetical protein